MNIYKFIFLFIIIYNNNGYAETMLNYDSALRSAGLRIFIADINNDGFPDFLLKPSPKVVVLPFDDDITVIPIPPVVPAFTLLSNRVGRYLLSNNANDISMEGQEWQPASFDILYGNIQGNGIESMLIKSKDSMFFPAGFVISISKMGEIKILQELTSSSIGVDLAGQDKTVVLKDQNGDGRSDLIVSVNNRVSDVLLADLNGMFHKNIESTVRAVWGGMLAALNQGNQDAALAYITPSSQASYRVIFSALGAKVMKFSLGLSDFDLVKITDKFAIGFVTRELNGKISTHDISFVMDGAGWSIIEF